ncbi:hypothetical protein [Albibacterium profundi]|uniref:Lipoprotein n=1 Tax=Albibacterium profundi TaxID=3134906 RepID=A0ABV5CD99_9SPHI
MKNLTTLSYILLLLITSCQQSNESEKDNRGSQSHTNTDSVTISDAFDKLRYNEEDTAQISSWLASSILKEDLSFLKSDQRRYQLDAYDLNKDGNMEYFIGFSNDYFCGSGGCTYYLVNHTGEVLSLFSVSRAPFYVLPSTTNGWYDLVINSNSGMRKLTFDGKSYPANPSILPAFDDSIQQADTTVILKDPKSYTF